MHRIQITPVSNGLQMKEIGKFGVDSGTVMIIDPCYIKDLDNPKFKNCTLDKLYEQLCDNDTATLGKSFAVASRTGWGDGVYSVYALYDDDRVMGVLIDFGLDLT